MIEYVFLAEACLDYLSSLTSKTGEPSPQKISRDDNLNWDDTSPSKSQKVFDTKSLRPKKPSDNVEDLFSVPTEGSIGFITKRIDDINKHALKRMEYMVDNQMSKISLFLFGENVIETRVDDLDDNLDRLMSYFVKTEQYEFAGRIRDLREKQSE
jgi:hypothetical protein